MRELLFVFIGLVLFAGCSDCPDNIETEVVTLTDTTLEWNPYFDVNTLVFSDQNANEHTLNKTLLDNVEAVQVSDECFQTLDLQNIITQFTDQETDDVVIDMKQSISFSENNDVFDFDDILDLNAIIYGVSTGNISLISDNRELVNIDFFDETIFVEDTTIYGKTFSNVYCSKPTSNRALFYTKELGVVYMKWKDGSYWLLEDRI